MTGRWRRSPNPFQVRWKGEPLDSWKVAKGQMTMSMRCLVCDIAWTLGKSEQQFYNEFSKGEREQIVATYLSRLERDAVRSEHPVQE